MLVGRLPEKIGFSVGGDDALVDAPGRFDLDMLLDAKSASIRARCGSFRTMPPGMSPYKIDEHTAALWIRLAVRQADEIAATAPEQDAANSVGLSNG